MISKAKKTGQPPRAYRRFRSAFGIPGATLAAAPLLLAGSLGAGSSEAQACLTSDHEVQVRESAPQVGTSTDKTAAKSLLLGGSSIQVKTFENKVRDIEDRDIDNKAPAQKLFQTKALLLKPLDAAAAANYLPHDASCLDQDGYSDRKSGGPTGSCRGEVEKRYAPHTAPDETYKGALGSSVAKTLTVNYQAPNFPQVTTHLVTPLGFELTDKGEILTSAYYIEPLKQAMELGFDPGALVASQIGTPQVVIFGAEQKNGKPIPPETTEITPKPAGVRVGETFTVGSVQVTVLGHGLTQDKKAIRGTTYAITAKGKTQIVYVETGRSWEGYRARGGAAKTTETRAFVRIGCGS